MKLTSIIKKSAVLTISLTFALCLAGCPDPNTGNTGTAEEQPTDKPGNQDTDTPGEGEQEPQVSISEKLTDTIWSYTRVYDDEDYLEEVQLADYVTSLTGTFYYSFQKEGKGKLYSKVDLAFKSEITDQVKAAVRSAVRKDLINLPLTWTVSEDSEDNKVEIKFKATVSEQEKEFSSDAEFEEENLKISYDYDARDFLKLSYNDYSLSYTQCYALKYDIITFCEDLTKEGVASLKESLSLAETDYTNEAGVFEFKPTGFAKYIASQGAAAIVVYQNAFEGSLTEDDLALLKEEFSEDDYALTHDGKFLEPSASMHAIMYDFLTGADTLEVKLPKTAWECSKVYNTNYGYDPKEVTSIQIWWEFYFYKGHTGKLNVQSSVNFYDGSAGPNKDRRAEIKAAVKEKIDKEFESVSFIWEATSTQVVQITFEDENVISAVKDFDKNEMEFTFTESFLDLLDLPTEYVSEYNGETYREDYTSVVGNLHYRILYDGIVIFDSLAPYVHGIMFGKYAGFGGEEGTDYIDNESYCSRLETFTDVGFPKWLSWYNSSVAALVYNVPGSKGYLKLLKTADFDAFVAEYTVTEDYVLTHDDKIIELTEAGYEKWLLANKTE